MKWDINESNSAVEAAKKLDLKLEWKSIVDQLAKELKPDKEAMEIYLETMRNESL